jgi:hypothetical protein
MTLGAFPSAQSLLILAAWAVVAGFLPAPSFRWERSGETHARLRWGD